jgi:hypothetical protein
MTYSFPAQLHVEYRRSVGVMASGNRYGTTTSWKPVQGPIRYAFDAHMMDLGEPITAVQVNGQWFMPFGGGNLHDRSTGEWTVWSVCADEQSCADFRIRKKGSSAKLKAAVEEMLRITAKVNQAELCKRFICSE